jgi:hypothetical protein
MKSSGFQIIKHTPLCITTEYANIGHRVSEIGYPLLI